MIQRFDLNNGWRLFHKHDPDYPLPAGIQIPEQGIPAEVPGTVHTDLMTAGIIPDPFFGDNEERVKWIDDQQWIYRQAFNIPPDLDKDKKPELVFNGLDTITEIRLNGQIIGDTQNMFIQHRLPVQQYLTKINELEIHFYPARRFGRENAKPIHQFPSARHPERVFVRKAQYSFGWDWGPALPTAGIWKDVYIEQTDNCRISSIYFETVKITDNNAEIKVKIDLDSDQKSTGFINISLDDGVNAIQDKIAFSKNKHAEWEKVVENPKLWWPAGSGKPFLYDLKISVHDKNGNLIDRKEDKVGIRTVKLITESEGKACFRFEVNGKTIFLKGANWIPADSFLPRVSKNKYRELLNFARKAHMNVLRVWGGGIYESAEFYKFCDELGLLVWQDLMFACAAYPNDTEFAQEVEKELRYNVSLLQYHPCILNWCGNNENEWIWYRDNCGPMNEMPGYRLFHHAFPKLFKELDPSRPYWPTSPFGDNTDPNDLKTGNRHVWDIWSYWKDYSEVISDESNFVTEFGFQGPANPTTLKKALPDDAFKMQHPLFEFHNKQDEGPERLIRFLNGHLPVKTDIDEFIYLTQLNQGLALKTCLEHWRLRFPETCGSIIWQLNDCWPVTSWSLIDSNLLPKLAWYFVKKVFSPQLVAFKKHESKIECIIDNQSPNPFKGRIKLFLFNGENGEVRIFEEIEATIKGNEREIVFNFREDILRSHKNAILYAALSDTNDKLLNDNFYSGTRFKHLQFKDAGLMVKSKQNENEVSIELKSDKPALFVALYHENLIFSENGFILQPNEKKQIVAKKLINKTIPENEILIFNLNTFL
jgi:beta-mannosidase